MKRVLIGIVAAILAPTSLPLLAQHREGHDRGRHEGHWPDREIHRFHERDIDVWRGGRWFHGRHEGRLGWWWIAAGLWYFYPAPVYPYPDPYAPPVVAPPVVVVPQAPAPPPPQTQYWYYCPSANGYYPYVPSCPEPWQPVPAQPQVAPR